MKTGKMNNARRLVLALALLAIAAMGVFPPWVMAPESDPSVTTLAGYHFILHPPSIPTGKLAWSSKHQRFEVDGKPVRVQAPPLRMGPQPMRIDGGAWYPPRFVRIDYARLLVQWIIVAALAGVAMLMSPRGVQPKP